MSKKVLVVDDEDDSRNLLKYFFERSGCSVIEAADGYEAVEKAVDQHPDLIVMDMAMPMMDGINSARTMRLHDDLSTVPIICLTAFGSFYEPRAMDAGCTEVLHKPVDFSELKPIIERHMH